MAREGNDAEGTKPVGASSSKTGPLAALTSWSCDDDRNPWGYLIARLRHGGGLQFTGPV